MRCGRLPLLDFKAVWLAAVLGLQPQSRLTAAVNQLVLTEVSIVRRNARAWLGLAEHDHNALASEDGYSEDEYAEDGSEIQNEDETPGGQLAAGSGTHIAIVRPRNFRDAITIGDYYRQDLPVIINLEGMDNAEARRIIDFVSGLTLGRYGDIERVSRRTFLIVPAGAAIITTHSSLSEDGFFNQA
jgi:cell division inhibitor SepF